MLPPVLEIYVVWHPKDENGEEIARAIVDHFHGTPFTGLIGGSIEVFIRSVGWLSAEDSPRPIPLPGSEYPTGMEPSKFTAIVPVIGLGIAEAVEADTNSWETYLQNIVYRQTSFPDQISIFPFLADRAAFDGTKLASILGDYQCLATNIHELDGEDLFSIICRELVQGIAQHISVDNISRLTIFVSHTKRARAGDEEDTIGLIDLVRGLIQKTRLQEFFDASDLQPGTRWDDVLRQNASTSTLLAIRTDLYASREWCQREVMISKQNGMPIVILDCLSFGEERGSFLMDHVPRIRAVKELDNWDKKAVYRALNLLVDECLKRFLWAHQKMLAEKRNLQRVSWWAPHAPEPVTILDWLSKEIATQNLPKNGDSLVILHPDPPLGADELKVIYQILEVSVVDAKLDIMTPRLLAARGG